MPCQAVSCSFSLDGKVTKRSRPELSAQRCPAIRAGPSRREAKWGRSPTINIFSKSFLFFENITIFALVFMQKPKAS